MNLFRSSANLSPKTILTPTDRKLVRSSLTYFRSNLSGRQEEIADDFSATMIGTAPNTNSCEDKPPFPRCIGVDRLKGFGHCE